MINFLAVLHFLYKVVQCKNVLQCVEICGATVATVTPSPVVQKVSTWAPAVSLVNSASALHPHLPAQRRRFHREIPPQTGPNWS